MTSFLQGIPVATGAGDTLEKCFRLEGPRGVSYDDYPGFHEWREDRNGVMFQEEKLDAVIDAVDGFREKLGQYTCTELKVHMHC